MRNNDGRNTITLEWALRTDPMELAQVLLRQFQVEIPPYIETADELNEAQSVISRSVSNYAFLDSMAQLIKMTKRVRKREGADKKEIEDLLSKEVIFSRLADQCKTAYQATSRLVTVRQLVLEELHMSDPY